MVHLLSLTHFICFHSTSAAGDFMSAGAPPPTGEPKLGQENKGHQLLMKMGRL